MDGEGIYFFGEDKKIYPHSREGGNLPFQGAGRATLALLRFIVGAGRALPAGIGRFPPAREWGMGAKAGISLFRGLGEQRSHCSDLLLGRGGRCPLVSGDSRLRGNGGKFFVIFFASFPYSRTSTPLYAE